MDLSIFLARFLGFYFLIVAVIGLIRKKQFETLLIDTVSSKSLLAFTGILSLLFGLAIAIAHPVWEWNWRGLITLLAYLSIVKGVIRLAFPSEAHEWILKWVHKGYWTMIAILAVLGLYLAYYGIIS